MIFVGGGRMLNFLFSFKKDVLSWMKMSFPINNMLNDEQFKNNQGPRQ